MNVTISALGSTGDSYDNALAESIVGLFKTEVIRRRGPWRGIEDVEFATLTWVAWYNAHRLLQPLGYVPPAEFEAMFYEHQVDDTELASLNKLALPETWGDSTCRRNGYRCGHRTGRRSAGRNSLSRSRSSSGTPFLRRRLSQASPRCRERR
jgi:hypothetical protein